LKLAAQIREIQMGKPKSIPKAKPNTPPAKHPGGRPAFYTTKEQLQLKIDEYFDSCWTDKVTEVTDKNGNCTMSTVRYQNRPYTVMGLVLSLGFSSRKALHDYKGKEEFSNAIKAARTKIEMYVEELMLEGRNAAGPIFWLKNNAEEKYKDKQEVDVTMIKPLVSLDDA
jgi:hypothetical protein